MQASPVATNAPVLHIFSEFYKLLYEFGKQIDKRERFGIWKDIEKIARETYALLIDASFAPHATKSLALSQARTKIEIIKRLIRLTHQLKIVDDKPYSVLITHLENISRQVGGWIKFAEQ
jgi:hypothetical protein